MVLVLIVPTPPMGLTLIVPTVLTPTPHMELTPITHIAHVTSLPSVKLMLRLTQLLSTTPSHTPTAMLPLLLALLSARSPPTTLLLLLLPLSRQYLSAPTKLLLHLLPLLLRLLPTPSPHITVLLPLSLPMPLLFSVLLPLLPLTKSPTTTTQHNTLLNPSAPLAQSTLQRTDLFSMLSSVRLRLTLPLFTAMS